MTPTSSKDIVHVTQDSHLSDALTILAPAAYVAVDTEFLREKTYFAKLCLVQLANEYGVVVVDVLALSTLVPLLDFIYDSARLKVLHAARQDLEVLSQAQQKYDSLAKSIIPSPIFDTQIAAGLLGLPAQIGYGDLLNQKLHVLLTKGLARTDWSQRPLSDEQLHYAADDVRYLWPLYKKLHDELQQKNRLQWLEEETSLLEAPALYQTLPEDAWQRLKGTQQLQPQQRAALKALAEWREARAIEKDKPRGWILSDESLRHISESLPTSMEELTHIHDLSEGIVQKSGETFLQLVTASQANAASELPANDFRPTSQQQSQVSQLMRKMRLIAEDNSISPELLMPRRHIEQLVFFNKRDAFVDGWRAQVIGTPMLTELEKIQQGK
jgi:ribonuclease D